MLVHPSELQNKFAKLCKIDPTKKGISTGFICLDKFVKLSKGYLMIMSGYPSSGKSEFLDAILLNLSITHQYRTLYFSPENHPVEEHLGKLAEKYIGKRLTKFNKNEIKSSLEYLEEYFSWIDLETPDLDTLIETAKQEKEERGLDVLVLDPWNAVTHARTGKEMIHEYLSNALSKLIQLSRKENILISIVAHPKIPVKDKLGKIHPPTLYDISDGAMWRNKADYGIICHRHDMQKDEMTVMIQKIKQKWMGQVGQVTLDYDWYSGRFKGEYDPEFLTPNEIPPPF